MSSKDTTEERLMHSKSDIIEIMINDKADEVVEDFFNHYLLDITFAEKQQWKAAVST